MASIPTKNPVPSESYVDLRYNSGVLDAFLNSQDPTFTDRLGNEKETLKSITVNAASAQQIESAKSDAEQAAESAEDSAQQASGYATAASGSASSASTSASAAASSASSASSSASAASSSASAAQSSATQAAALSSSTIVGESRNLVANLSAAATSVSFTADEIVVANSLNGTHYRLPSFSKAINISTTGVGGMDTGTAPATGYVAIYAIYNPSTQASALLAVNATSAKAPEVYGGSNMPSGYTASCLIMVWRTASSQLVQGRVQGRSFFSLQQIAISGAAATTYTSVSLSGSVPLNAQKVSGWSALTAATTSEAVTNYIASDAAGISVHRFVGVGYCGANFNIPLVTPQSLFRRTGQTGTSTLTQDVYITGYEV